VPEENGDAATRIRIGPPKVFASLSREDAAPDENLE
jgi:hypothetical protein